MNDPTNLITNRPTFFSGILVSFSWHLELWWPTISTQELSIRSEYWLCTLWFYMCLYLLSKHAFEIPVYRFEIIVYLRRGNNAVKERDISIRGLKLNYWQHGFGRETRRNELFISTICWSMSYLPHSKRAFPCAGWEECSVVWVTFLNCCVLAMFTKHGHRSWLKI